MQPKHLVIVLTGALLLAGACNQIQIDESATTPAAEPCDRACLEGLVDETIEAFVAHDPSRLSMTEDVVFTENGQKLRLGDGLWNTVGKRGTYSLYMADPEAGQVGFFGTIWENDWPAILAFRLKVENREISEMEVLVARGAGEDRAHGDRGARALEEMDGPRPAFLEIVPPEERLSREELIRIANMYFIGLERNDGKGEYPFTDDCNRIENGEYTTNKPADPPVRFDVTSMGCKEQFETGFFHFVTRIRDRRFVVVDQERHLVLAFVFFDHAGNVAPVTRPDGQVLTGGPIRPFTWEIAEVFKIEDGLLDQIEAVVNHCPYGMGSGWSSWEDSLSSEIQVEANPLPAM